MKINLLKKCSKIKVLLTDVDGVLTDGGMYYSNKGDVMKKFHVRDGMGVTLLRKNKIPTIIVTKEKTEIIKRWAKKMKVESVYDGVIEKESIIKKICDTFKVTKDEIAYIGDDINDIKLMKLVGLSATPRDANKNAKQIAAFICKTKSGDGVLREIADLILEVKFPKIKEFY